jgi:hypothetical protein
LTTQQQFGLSHFATPSLLLFVFAETFVANRKFFGLFSANQLRTAANCAATLASNQALSSNHTYIYPCLLLDPSSCLVQTTPAMKVLQDVGLSPSVRVHARYSHNSHVSKNSNAPATCARPSTTLREYFGLKQLNTCCSSVHLTVIFAHLSPLLFDSLLWKQGQWR